MSIKERLRQNFLIGQYISRKRLANWVTNGFQNPVPHELKQLAIRYYAASHKLETFIETGTYKGDMVWAQKDFFKDLFSIELSSELYDQAKIRFRDFDHIHLVKGDSSEKIADILKQVSSPSLIFLDGHYSGGVTALGAKECPIFEELEQVFASPLDHFVIIDDARLFTGKNDYPTIEELSNFVSSKSSYAVRTESDFIILDPCARRL